MADGGEDRKKRAADRQITKDDPQEDDDTNDDVEQPAKGFPKADAETMKKRRIVKAKRSDANSSEETKGSNPFASLASSKPGVFGSSFSGNGFGAAGKTDGGGFGAATKTGGGFSLGFASAQNTTTSSTASVFGSSTVFSGGLTSATSSESAFGASSTSKSEPQVTFPENVEITTGEEGETQVLEVRAKSYVLVEKEDPPAAKLSDQVDDSVHSVPPSSSHAVSSADTNDGTGNTAADKSKATDDDQQAETEEDGKAKVSQEEKSGETEKNEGTESDPSKDEGNADTKENGEQKKKKREGGKTLSWQELGIGPLRILRKDEGHGRVVQRRETAKGGSGTKLILNAPLAKESKVSRPDDHDRHVRFTTIEPSGKAAVYLLKVSTKTEADDLQRALEKEVAQAASVVKS